MISLLDKTDHACFLSNVASIPKGKTLNKKEMLYFVNSFQKELPENFHFQKV